MAGILDDVVAEVLFAISQMPEAGQQEYLSLVYQDPRSGEYKWAEPMNVARNEAGGPKRDTKSSATWYIPAGSARALVHNHPGESSKGRGFRNFFSDLDVAQAQKLGLPSFIGTDQGDIRVFDPANPGRIIKGAKAATQGDPVLAQYPWEAHKARIMENFALMNRRRVRRRGKQ